MPRVANDFITNWSPCYELEYCETRIRSIKTHRRLENNLNISWRVHVHACTITTNPCPTATRHPCKHRMTRHLPACCPLSGRVSSKPPTPRRMHLFQGGLSFAGHSLKLLSKQFCLPLCAVIHLASNAASTNGLPKRQKLTRTSLENISEKGARRKAIEIGAKPPRPRTTGRLPAPRKREEGIQRRTILLRAMVSRVAVIPSTSLRRRADGG